MVGDKCLGMLEAVGEVFPEAKDQRCTVHFCRNVFSVVPHSKIKLLADFIQPRKNNGKIRDMEIKSLKPALAELKDPRRTEGGHILHKLEDIIIIGPFTLLYNGEYFTDMEAFGELRKKWLRQFLELSHRIPDSDFDEYLNE